MSLIIPFFKYHPYPLESGSAKQIDFICNCCENKQSYAYSGPIYCTEDPEGLVCLFCISDGSAAKKYRAEFTGSIFPDQNISEKDLLELKTKTPGYLSWQESVWLTHCNYICEYNGLFEKSNLLEKVENFRDMFFESFGKVTKEELMLIIYSYDPKNNDNPGYHKFSCIKCGEELLSIDYT